MGYQQFRRASLASNRAVTTTTPLLRSSENPDDEILTGRELKALIASSCPVSITILWLYVIGDKHEVS